MANKLDDETVDRIDGDCEFECEDYFTYINRLEKTLKKECAKRKYMRRVSYAA